MFYVVRFIHDGVDKTEEVYQQYGLEVHLPPLPEKPMFEDSPSLSVSDDEVIADENTTKVQAALWNAMYRR